MYKRSMFLVTTSLLSGTVESRILVFQTKTAFTVLLSPSAWSAIECGEFNRLGETLCDALLRGGVLVASDCDELDEVLTENVVECDTTTTLYQVIMPTADCQLACNDGACGAYCGQSHEKVELSEEFDGNILAKIESRLNLRAFTKLKIGWFGGEPLLGMRTLRRLTPKLQLLASKYQCDYSAKIVTNGLALSPERIIELTNSMKVNSFEITLDGSADFHDGRRATKIGHKPTFSKILGNIECLVESTRKDDCLINIRCNVDRRNIAGVIPLINLLKVKQMASRVNFYIAPVHPWGNSIENVAMSKEQFSEFEISIFKHLIAEGFEVGLVPKRRKVTCIATQSSGAVYDPYGYVHRCTETPLVKNYQDSNTQLVAINRPHQEKANRFATPLGAPVDMSFAAKKLTEFSSIIGAKEVPCSECPILPLCGGSCPLLWGQGISACPPVKFNIEERLRLAYEIATQPRNVQTQYTPSLRSEVHC